MTTPAMETTRDYAAAHDHLAALEAELAALEGRIQQAAAAGQMRAVGDALARKAALPHLVDQARRELAPLALAHFDAAIAAAQAEAAPRGRAVEDAHAALLAAQAAYAEAWDAAREHSEHMKELQHQRKLAWRACQALAAAAD